MSHALLQVLTCLAFPKVVVKWLAIHVDEGFIDFTSPDAVPESKTLLGTNPIIITCADNGVKVLFR